ncbi:hypothetical protein [Bacillus smithii]|uniref:hypothetical protein n=1 Tax=Bacillus smithii TaxID=1479 RepID=UPI003D248D98
MTNYKEHYQKAMEIKDSVTKWYLDFSTQARKEIDSAKLNTDLSPEGRQKEAGIAMAVNRLELLRGAYKLKKSYISQLKQAQDECKKLIDQKIEKPEQDEIDKFNSKLGKLKTSLMLATTKETAEKLLDQFISEIKDPYFANVLVENFSDVSRYIIEAANGDKATKLKLAQIFESLQNDFADDDVKEARKLMEVINAKIEHESIFPPVAIENSKDLFGEEISLLMNKPEEFFQGDKEKWIPSDDEDFRLTMDKVNNYIKENGVETLNSQLTGKMRL